MSCLFHCSVPIDPLLLVVAVLALAVTLSIVWTTIRVGISPMPSSGPALRAMVDLIPPEVSGQAVDLGSGWGQLAIALKTRRPGLEVTGYERSPIPWAWARAWAWLRRHPVRFHRRDLFEADLGAVRVVVCYLCPELMERLARELRQLTPGTIIVSNTFRLPGWAPDEVVELRDLHGTRVYRYLVPALRSSD